MGPRYLTIKYSSSAVKTESAQVYSPGFVRGPFTMANLQISIILQCGYSEIFTALVLHIYRLFLLPAFIFLVTDVCMIHIVSQGFSLQTKN